MFALNENNRFYFRYKPTDLCKGFNILVGCVNNGTNLNPIDGSLYIFIDKSRDTLKLLHWVRGGFVIYHKRLESGRVSNTIFYHDILFTPIKWNDRVLLLEEIHQKQGKEKDIICE